jgi:hypothetical protein
MDLAGQLEDLNSLISTGFSDWENFGYANFVGIAEKVRIGILQSLNPKVKIREYGLGYGFSSISPDRFEGKKRNNWIFVLKDIPAIAPKVDLSDFMLDGKQFDKDSLWLQSIDLTTEFKTEVDKHIAILRSKSETQIRGVVRLSLTCLVIRMAIGWEKSKRNPMLQRLKWYIFSFLKGSEPFREDVNGDIVLVERDTLAPLRCYILVHAAFWYEAFADEIGENIFTEYVDYLLPAPNVKGKEFKDKTSVLFSAFADESVTRYVCKWDANKVDQKFAVLTGYTTMIEKGISADKIHYEYLKRTGLVDEGFKFLQNNDLTSWLMAFRYLIKGGDTRACRMFCILQGFRAVPGYSRANRVEAQIKSLSFPRLKRDFKPSFEDILYNSWTAIFEYGFEHDLFPNYHEYQRISATTLTTRSAGGDKLNLRVLAPLTRAVRAGVRNLGPSFGRDRLTEIKFRFTGKRPVFYSNAWKYYTREAMDQTYTTLEPLVAGSRNVPDFKLDRVVNPRRLGHSIAEVIEARILQSYCQRKDMAYSNIGSAWDFTAGRQKGSILADHAKSFIATTTDGILSAGFDFSSYDLSQQTPNVWRIKKEAIHNTLTARGFTSNFGPWTGGLVEFFEHLFQYGNIEDAVIESRGISSTKQIAVDILQSGHLFTLDMNSIDNQAFLIDFYNHVEVDEQLRGKISLLDTNVMGDDSLTYWFVPDVRVWNVELYTYFVNLVELVAKKNGFVINAVKSDVTATKAEYLKKRVFCGRYLPLLHTQIFATEKGDSSSPPIDVIRGYASQLTTFGFRFGNHGLLNKILMYTWIVRSSVSVPINLKQNERYHLPFSVLYAPHPGAGQIPWSLVGTSKDALIAIYAKLNDEFYIYIARALGVVTIRDSNVAQTIAKIVVGGKKYKVKDDESVDITANAPISGSVEPSNPLAPGIKFNYMHMPKERIMAALEAEKKMRDLNMPDLGALRYIDWPETEAVDIIASDTNVKKIEALNRSFAGLSYIKNATDKVEIDPLYRHKWVQLLEFRKTSEAEKTLRGAFDPFPMAQQPYSMILSYLGVNTERSSFEVSPNVIMNILRRDPMWRRNIQDTTLFRYLTNPRVLASRERVYLALVAMGARKETASQVATSYNLSSSAMAMTKAMIGYSTSDNFLSNVNFSRDIFMRLIKLPDLGDRVIEAMIYEIAMLYLITESVREGFVRNMEIIVSNDTIKGLKKAVYGKNQVIDVSKMQGIYSKRDLDEWTG